MTPFFSFSVFLTSSSTLGLSLHVMIVWNHFCFLYFAAALFSKKFCLSNLNWSVTCFPSCICRPGSMAQRIVSLLREDKESGPWLGSKQADLMARRFAGSGTSHLPVYWVSLRAKGPSSKHKGLACVTRLSADRWLYCRDLGEDGWVSSLTRTATARQAQLLPCQLHQLLLLLYPNLPPELGAAWPCSPPCGLTGCMDLLCFDVTLGPVNRTTVWSTKEQKNETVQKYKPKVLSKKKMPQTFQLKLNVNRVLVGCWWGLQWCVCIFIVGRFMAIEIWMRLILHLY